jgi:hypothetical protein
MIRVKVKVRVRVRVKVRVRAIISKHTPTNNKKVGVGGVRWWDIQRQNRTHQRTSQTNRQKRGAGGRV